MQQEDPENQNCPTNEGPIMSSSSSSCRRVSTAILNFLGVYWVQSFCQPSSLKPIRPIRIKQWKPLGIIIPISGMEIGKNTVTKIIENHKPEMQDIHG